MENVRRKCRLQEPTEKLIRVAWKSGQHNGNGNGSKNERFFFQSLSRLWQLGQSVNSCFAYQTYCFLILEVLVPFAVHVGVAKLSSQVCPYSELRLVLFGFASCTIPWVSLDLSYICISQNIVLLTYNLFCLNNKGGA